LFAILATAQLIPRDLEDRTIYTILAKPVARVEYLLGKLTGVLLLLAFSMVIMSLLFVIVLKWREQTVLNQTAQQLRALSPEQIAEALDAVRASAFNGGLWPGFIIIYVKACLLAALTLFVSTFATTTIFSTMVMMFVYLIGHLQSIARSYWLETHTASWVAQGFLAAIALFFPDLQLFNLVDDMVAGATIPMTLFAKTILLGGFYTCFYLLLAWSVFSQKEL
jgi:ABC-type Na+ efflux pump permease subunit